MFNGISAVSASAKAIRGLLGLGGGVRSAECHFLIQMTDLCFRTN